MLISKYKLPGTRKPRKQKRQFYQKIKYFLPKEITYQFIADNLHRLKHFKKEIRKRNLLLYIQSVLFYEQLKRELNSKTYNYPIVGNDNKLNFPLFSWLKSYRRIISFSLIVLLSLFIIDTYTSAKMLDTRLEDYVFKGKLVNKKNDALAGKLIEIFDSDAIFRKYTVSTDANGNFESKITIVGIEEIADNVPKDFSVSFVYPNPTAGSFSSNLNLPYSGNVDVSVFDIAGRKVLDVFSGHLDAGKYKLFGNLGDDASASYYMNVNVNGANFSANKTEKIMKISGYHVNGANNTGIRLEGSANVTEELPDYLKRLAKANNDKKVDSIIVHVDSKSKIKLFNIPLNDPTIDLGTLVGNETPKSVSSIPNVTLKEGEKIEIKLSDYFKNDNGTNYTSSIGTVSGDKLTILVDSLMKSGNITVRAIDAEDSLLFAETLFDLVARHPTRLIIGPIYDLWTKYDKSSTPENLIAGTKTPVSARVTLGSDPSKYADVDMATGMVFFNLGYDKTGKDSIFIVPYDTAFVKYKNNRLNLVEGDNIIKAFNDDTGIPLFKAGKEVLDYFVLVSNIANIVDNNKPEYSQTGIRLKSGDIKINMNRNKDPTNYQADSLWYGMSKLVEGINSAAPFNIIKITESDVGNQVNVRYDAGSDGLVMNVIFGCDEKYYYLSFWEYGIRGPPIRPNLNLKQNVSYIGAHEFMRVILGAPSKTSPDIKDIMYSSTTQRVGQKIYTFGTQKEFLAATINFLLERNAKWLDYSK